MKKRNPLIVLAAVWLTFLGACRSSTPPRYFVLSPHIGETVSETSLALGIGPVTLPAYLDRTHVVSRNGDELIFDDHLRWAEPLDQSFIETLGEVLALQASAARVETFPWPQSTRVDYRLTGEVSRFDLDGNGVATLALRWRLTDQQGRPVGQPRRSRFAETATDLDPANQVHALSRTLAALAAEILDSLPARSGTSTDDQ